MIESHTSEKPSLTSRQKEIYEFLKDKILNRGYGPTVREIGNEFGIRSPNGVMCHLKALEKKGLITRESHMSRAIQLASSPSNRLSMTLPGTVTSGGSITPRLEQERIDFSALFDEDHVCLKVQGNGFLSDHIRHGDCLVIQKSISIEDGQQVLAVVRGHGACIRRVYREVDRVRLEALGMAPLFANPSDIIGRLRGVIRENE